MNSALKEYRKEVDELLEDRRYLKRSIKAKAEAQKSATERIQKLLEAQSILQEAGAHVQEQAHVKIASVVTKCLESVFENPYTFKIHFERKRNATEAKIVFERDGQEVDPLTASGGGAVDVAAFALRMACLVLSRPKKRRVLFLDEPFRFVSEKYRPNIKEMLETLSSDLGVQIVMITHIRAIETGTIVHVK